MGCRVNRQAKLRWEQGFPKQIGVSRALADRREPIQEIKSHGFGDASGASIGAFANAVVKQESVPGGL